MLGACAIASRATAPGRIHATVVSPPDLEVSAADLDFGYAMALSHTRTLTVRNVSGEDALVALSFEGFPSGIEVVYFADDPYPCSPGGLCAPAPDVAPQASPLRLQPGEAVVFYVRLRAADVDAELRPAATGKISVIGAPAAQESFA